MIMRCCCSLLLFLAVLALLEQPADATSFSWDKFQAAAKEEAAKMEKAAKIAGSKVAEEASVVEKKIAPTLKRGAAWADKTTAEGVRNRAKNEAKRLEKRAVADVAKDKRLKEAEEAWRKRGTALLAEQKDLEQQEKHVAMMETALQAARRIGGGSSGAIVKQEEDLNAKEAELSKARKREERHRSAWRIAGAALRLSEDREAKMWSALDEAAVAEETRAGTVAKGAALLGLKGSNPASAAAAKELEADRKKWAAMREKLDVKARQGAAKSLVAEAGAEEKALRADDAEVAAAELARGAEELARLRRAARAARDSFLQQRSTWRDDAKAIAKVASQALAADVRAAHGEGGSAAALVKRMDKMVLEWGLKSSEIDDAVRRLDATREAVSALHRVLNGITHRTKSSVRGASRATAKLREAELEHVRAAGDGWAVDEKALKALAASWAVERSKTQRKVDTQATQATHDEEKVEKAAKKLSAEVASAKTAALEQQLEHERKQEHSILFGGAALAALALVGAAVLLVKLRQLRYQLRQRLSTRGSGGSADGGGGGNAYCNVAERPSPYSDSTSVGARPAPPAPPASSAPPALRHAEAGIEMGASASGKEESFRPGRPGAALTQDSSREGGVASTTDDSAFAFMN